MSGMLKLVFLGTSAAMPTVKRALTCICLVRDNEILMFDAGEGAQISYLKMGLPWNKKMKIFVTHLHGDHCVGILGLLQTMNMQSRTEPVEIFGPEGIDEFIAANIKILNFRFFPDKAKELGIPEGRDWHELQNGNSIEINGKKILPEDVTGEKRAGKNIGVSGDTRPTEELTKFFDNCDYLIFDCTFSDELKERARETNHSTAKEAGELAKNANVGKLILTHFSARYKDEDVLLDEAKKIHESTIAAKDLMEIEIQR